MKKKQKTKNIINKQIKHKKYLFKTKKSIGNIGGSIMMYKDDFIQII
jgi:hypothetical protein